MSKDPSNKSPDGVTADVAQDDDRDLEIEHLQELIRERDLDLKLSADIGLQLVAENNELKGSVASTEEKLESTTREREELKSLVVTLRAKIAALDDTIERSADAVSVSNDQKLIEESSRSNEIERRNRELQLQVDSLKKSSKRLEEDNDRLIQERSEIDERLQEFDSILDKVAFLQKQLEEQQKLREDAPEDEVEVVDGQQHKTGNLMQQSSDYLEEIESLRLQLEERTAKLEQQQQLIDSLQDKVRKHEELMSDERDVPIRRDVDDGEVLGDFFGGNGVVAESARLAELESEMQLLRQESESKFQQILKRHNEEGKRQGVRTEEPHIFVIGQIEGATKDKARENFAVEVLEYYCAQTQEPPNLFLSTIANRALQEPAILGMLRRAPIFMKFLREKCQDGQDVSDDISKLNDALHVTETVTKTSFEVSQEPGGLQKKIDELEERLKSQELVHQEEITSINQRHAEVVAKKDQEAESRLNLAISDLESSFALERGSLQGQIDGLEEQLKLQQEVLDPINQRHRAETQLHASEIASSAPQVEELQDGSNPKQPEVDSGDEIEDDSASLSGDPLGGLVVSQGNELSALKDSLKKSSKTLSSLDNFNLSISDIKGNIKDPDEMKKKFPDKASQIDEFKYLPIEFYDGDGLAILQEQINQVSSMKWSRGRVEGVDGRNHKALVSYAFDGNNYRVIVAQQGKVSMNFVSEEYMRQRNEEIKNTYEARKVDAKTAGTDDKPIIVDKSSDAYKASLSKFYRNQEREIEIASRQIAMVAPSIAREIYGGEDASDKKGLFNLVSPSLATPLSLGSGYSIARQQDGDKSNIRITCMADENGEFKDNVIYANVTGTSFYVKVQVARSDDEIIDKKKRQKGDIVILPGFYSEPKADSLITRKLTEEEKKVVDNCNIVATAVIGAKDKDAEVKTSAAVKFNGKIKNVTSRQANREDVLHDHDADVKSRTGRSNAGSVMMH